MIEDKQVVMQIFGSIIQNPTILSQSDKYTLTVDDFSSQFERKLFMAMYSLYEQGAKYFTALDIDNYIRGNGAAYSVWQKQNGMEYLQDAEEFSNPENFDYYYSHLKKINALNGLERIGYDISQFYCSQPMTQAEIEINNRFEILSVQDIFNVVKKDISATENRLGASKSNKKVKAGFQIRELLENLKQNPDIGPNLQGDIFNAVVRGARKGKFYLRSGSSGAGKSRNLVGDACYLAYPIRYDWNSMKWVQMGDCEKCMYIATEQGIDEIQTMILAYLSGINEDKILNSTYNEQEEEILEKSLLIMEYFCDNLILAQMPNPDTTQVQNIVRSTVLEQGVENIFYDYIFSNAALLNEYRDLKIQEHQILGMFSNELKNLAVDLDVFIMSSTQTNAQVEDGTKAIKNESVLRGARSLSDKIDVGVVITRPTEDDLHIVQDYSTLIPNLVTDVYKVRRGRYTQVRIWSSMDAGTCRKRDLFVTTGDLKIIDIKRLNSESAHEEEMWDAQSFLTMLNEADSDSIQEKIKKEEEPHPKTSNEIFAVKMQTKIEKDKGSLFKGLI